MRKQGATRSESESLGPRAQAVLPCELASEVAGRPDKAVLLAHLDAIEGHEAKFRARLAEIDSGPDKAKVTEALGERAATLFMVQHYGASRIQQYREDVASNKRELDEEYEGVGDEGYQIVSTFRPGTGYDQLWVAWPRWIVLPRAMVAVVTRVCRHTT